MMLAVKDVIKMMNSKLKIYRHVRGNLVCSLEKGMATHSRILVWRIPWTGVPGGLQSGVRELDMTRSCPLCLFTPQEVHTLSSTGPEKHLSESGPRSEAG